MVKKRPMQGTDRIWLMRLLEEEASEHGTKLAWQTELETKIKVDSDVEMTKDGAITTVGAPEYDISVTCFLDRTDPWNDKIYSAVTENKMLGLWEIDRGAQESDGKYPGIYYEGFITEYSLKADAEDFLELELSFAIDQVGQKGMFTLSKEASSAVQYIAKDTTPQV